MLAPPPLPFIDTAPMARPTRSLAHTRPRALANRSAHTQSAHLHKPGSFASAPPRTPNHDARGQSPHLRAAVVSAGSSGASRPAALGFASVLPARERAERAPPPTGRAAVWRGVPGGCR